MADETLTSAPQISAVIPQQFIVEALGGAENPVGLLNRFPDGLYHKSPESHLLRFIYALLGPSGVGSLSDNYLKARLKLEEMGLELFDLDAFFGNPLGFGRILEEEYDTADAADSDARAQITARDAAYRSRALDFLGGARLGNSPQGMQLVARAGLGHDVEIVENYKYLYDVHTDRPVGFRSFGKTVSTEEMIVIPRQEISTSEVQEIKIVGGPTSGAIIFSYNGRITSNVTRRNVPWNAPAISSWDLTDPENPALDTLGVQEALEAIPDIGEGNVRVTGGPGPDIPWTVTFQGKLARQDTLPLTVESKTLSGGLNPAVVIKTLHGGVDATEEVVDIPPRDLYHLQQALDRIKPVTMIPTVSSGSGTRQRQAPLTDFASSEFTEVLRFVNGLHAVPWPSSGWIEGGKEKQAPRAYGSDAQHYRGFHDVVSTVAYGQAALDDANYEADRTSTALYVSEHIGPFGPDQRAIYPMLGADAGIRYTSDRALADYPEQPIMGAGGLVNGIYDASYASLPGTRQIIYKDEQYWSSVERIAGAEYLELDLGTVQVVNFIGFETLTKPMQIEVAVDILDQHPRRKFVSVSPVGGIDYPDQVSASASGWTYLEFNFSDVRGEPFYTRFVRIKLDRVVTPTRPFLLNPVTRVSAPWSVEVRNLRLGRNVSN
ncbi:DUF7297 family protein [Candidatus Solirubrobacter pratensis]|uniref:DUF7297 family protein n=1 Tax=Candidatus Solirubrobacter pratensis TaxID=1298857 RepID=UPI000411CEA4|nr:hypothetical protein [Candidatus Solirubrobacter pratensis]